jgi:hypothetical protein
MIPEHHVYSDFSSAIKALETGEAFLDVPKKDTFSWAFVTR